MRMRHLLLPLTAALLAVPAGAQSIVSARSGAVHYVEGTAFVDGEKLVVEHSKFYQLKPGDVFKTGEGRAEILLTPGVILRIAEDSSVEMVSNELSDTRVKVRDGSALVEVMEILDGNKVTFLQGDATVELRKPGLYRFDSDPAQLRVYKGKAAVREDGRELLAKKNRVVELEDTLVAAKFDAKQDDALYRWSSRRSGYLAMANLSAARRLNNWGSSWNSSGWAWNPYFGMFTFVPSYGSFMSPFGYSYWSPRRVYVVYSAPPVSVGAAGYGGGSGISGSSAGASTGVRGVGIGGHRGGGSGAPGPAVSAPGPAVRGGSSAIGRGGSGGGRGR